LSLTLVLAIAAVGFLVSYLFFKTEDNEEYNHHFLLRLLLLGVLFGVFVLLGKAGIDSGTSCDLVVVNKYDDHSVNPDVNVTYTYDTICYSNTDANTAVTFYTLTLWLVRLLTAYILIYFLYEVFKYFERIVRGKRGRSKNER
jgi:uncharacterized membrane protein YbhN (UPF0104 family)